MIANKAAAYDSSQSDIPIIVRIAPAYIGCLLRYTSSINNGLMSIRLQLDGGMARIG